MFYCKTSVVYRLVSCNCQHSSILQAASSPVNIFPGPEKRILHIYFILNFRKYFSYDCELFSLFTPSVPQRSYLIFVRSSDILFYCVKVQTRPTWNTVWNLSFLFYTTISGINLTTVDIAYVQVVLQFARTVVLCTVRSSWISTDSKQPICSS